MSSSESSITAFNVADWFLAKAKEEYTELRHMKLQKLVYFAYGWYFAYFDQPMFEETIYAWRHGPVVKELYDRFKLYDADPITEDVPRRSFDTHAEGILDMVWKAYKQYTDTELRNTTHTHLPWILAFNSSEWNPVMSPVSIQSHFNKLLETSSNVPH